MPHPSRFVLGKTQYPLYKRLGWMGAPVPVCTGAENLHTPLQDSIPGPSSP